MTELPLIVIKIGGSLLDLPDLPQRLVNLIRQQPACRPLFIAGGGTAADCVRDWHRTFALAESASHNLAMRSMSLTARLLEQIVPGGRCVTSASAAFACWTQGEWPILDVHAWWNSCESHRLGIPESWDVTSDSLAAWLACQWSAEELWLCKSTDDPADLDWQSTSQRGLVDAYFPRVARNVKRVRWCNLRRDSPVLIPLHQ